MELFVKIFEEATLRIGNKYYEIPIDGGSDVFRERVYCYELYHQLRKLWPKNSEYTLNGELNKISHPLLKKLDIKSSPDFLVHQPGYLKGNYLIIEVKHTLNDSGTKDLKTINNFIEKAGYKKGIYLLYGPATTSNEISAVMHQYQSSPDILSEIELWTHKKPGEKANLEILLSKNNLN